MALERLGPRVYAWVGTAGATNAGFILGDETVAVVDSLLTPTAARHLQQRIQGLSSRPIGFLINTHYHGDHTFGNQVFGSAAIVGHARTREGLLRFGAEQLKFFRGRQPLLAREFDQVRLTPPNLTVESGCNLFLGDLEVQVRHLGPAHTPGDLVVWVPNEGVLFAGDLIFNGWFPTAAEANIAGWVQCLSALEAFPVRLVVPGHGPIGGREVIRRLREYFEGVQVEVERARAAGLSWDEAVAKIQPGEAFADWQGSERHAAIVRRLWEPATSRRD